MDTLVAENRLDEEHGAEVGFKRVTCISGHVHFLQLRIQLKKRTQSSLYLAEFRSNLVEKEGYLQALRIM